MASHKCNCIAIVVVRKTNLSVLYNYDCDTQDAAYDSAYDFVSHWVLTLAITMTKLVWTGLQNESKQFTSFPLTNADICWSWTTIMKENQCKTAAPVTRGWQDQDQSVNCKPSFLLTLITLKTQSYCAGKRWTKHENVLAIKHHVNCNSIESKSFTQLNKHNAKRQKISGYAWSLVADFVTLFFDVFVWAFMWSSHFSFTLNQWAPFLWNLSWSHWCLNK